MQLDSILILSAAATTFVTVLVNALTQAWPLRPPWVAIAAALALGVLIVLVLQVAFKVPLTSDIMAASFLAGILAGGGAAGITATGNTAQAVRTEAKAVQKAADAPPTNF